MKWDKPQLVKGVRYIFKLFVFMKVGALYPDAGEYNFVLITRVKPLLNIPSLKVNKCTWSVK